MYLPHNHCWEPWFFPESHFTPENSLSKFVSRSNLLADLSFICSNLLIHKLRKQEKIMEEATLLRPWVGSLRPCTTWMLWKSLCRVLSLASLENLYFSPSFLFPVKYLFTYWIYVHNLFHLKHWLMILEKMDS